MNLTQTNDNALAMDLAIFGARPAFDNPLHVGRPNIGDRELLHGMIDDLLDRRWLTNNGPFVQRFEKEMAETLGVRHCIAMCNGTMALEITIRALGLKGEVIIPSFTFVAVAHSLQWQEITPVFCDIDPSTHSIDPDCVEAMITPRTSGVIGVHLWGKPCAIEQLSEMAHRRGLQLMFDGSHAFGCSHNGKMIGNFGRAEIFSFHATKFLNCLEGGAVATNDDELAKKIRLMKNFGFCGYDDVIYIGTNGKMDEISAAMGLVNLKSSDEFVNINKRNQTCYAAELAGIPGIKLLEYDDREKCNFQYVVATIDERKSPLTRDELLKVLHAENILARRYFWPGCHRMEPYRSYFPHASLLLPRTEEIASRVLVLPNGSTVSPADIRVICSVIQTALANAKEIKGILGQT